LLFLFERHSDLGAHQAPHGTRIAIMDSGHFNETPWQKDIR
jgi:hypothetical protein